MTRATPEVLWPREGTDNRRNRNELDMVVLVPAMKPYHNRMFTNLFVLNQVNIQATS